MALVQGPEADGPWATAYAEIAAPPFTVGGVHETDTEPTGVPVAADTLAGAPGAVTVRDGVTAEDESES